MGPDLHVLNLEVSHDEKTSETVQQTLANAQLMPDAYK